MNSNIAEMEDNKERIDMWAAFALNSLGVDAMGVTPETIATKCFDIAEAMEKESQKRTDGSISA